MINLLPQKERDMLYEKQLEKLIIVLGMTILIGLVCLFLILLSVRLYILGQTTSQRFEFEGAQKKVQSSESLNLKNMILEYNGVLSRVDLFYNNQLYMSQILGVLFGVSKPEGLYFTAVSIDTTQENADEVGIVLSGVSGTRDELTNFKKIIEEEKMIKSAYFPPESWVSAKNINFNITLKVLKEEVGNNRNTDE